MNQLLDWLSKLLGSWKPWVVIPPWDIGVRVRVGKTAVRLLPGPHLRIPFIDEVMLVNTRLRITSCPAVTITADEGKSRVLSATIGYCIDDPLLAMMRFDPPQTAIDAVAMSALSKGSTADEALDLLRKFFDGTGVRIEVLTYSDDVVAMPIRLLNNHYGINTPRNEAVDRY